MLFIDLKLHFFCKKDPMIVSVGFLSKAARLVACSRCVRGLITMLTIQMKQA